MLPAIHLYNSRMGEREKETAQTGGRERRSDAVAVREHQYSSEKHTRVATPTPAARENHALDFIAENAEMLGTAR